MGAGSGRREDTVRAPPRAAPVSICGRWRWLRGAAGACCAGDAVSTPAAGGPDAAGAAGASTKPVARCGGQRPCPQRAQAVGAYPAAHVGGQDHAAATAAGKGEEAAQAAPEMARAGRRPIAMGPGWFSLCLRPRSTLPRAWQLAWLPARLLQVVGGPVRCCDARADRRPPRACGKIPRAYGKIGPCGAGGAAVRTEGMCPLWQQCLHCRRPVSGQIRCDAYCERSMQPCEAVAVMRSASGFYPRSGPDPAPIRPRPSRAGTAGRLLSPGCTETRRP